MRNETHTINGLLAYKLHLSKITSERDFSQTQIPGQLACAVGMRVWKRNSGGSETEVTSGTPVAQVTYSDGDIKVTRSNTWVCPLTALNSTDAIKVVVYASLGGSWVKIGSGAYDSIFITEQLGASSLDNNTWTVYYTCSFSYRFGIPTKCQITLYIDGANNSRIEGFKWTVAVAAKKPVGDGLTFTA